jgi:beta-galactosidase
VPISCVRLLHWRHVWNSAVLATALLAGELRADDASFRTIDLRSVVNMDWRDEVWGDGKGGWTDQGDNDMRAVKVGKQTLLGVPLDLLDPAANGGKAVLTLGSKKFLAGPRAATVPVRQKARGLYFLHAAAWSAGHMATYLVRYADGTRAEIPIRDKEEIMNWWYPVHGAKFRAAIHVPNAQTDDVGLLLYGWDNPKG